MNRLITELINDEAVYRTAPATPGLLISRVQPGKPGIFLPLGPFPFQYSSDVNIV